ncbi:sugar phosphate isomerase/epimerase family protein [Phycisphaera mikurensis]|uniref:Xylose isomerase-like TIM barrel domain-containing protein n=1 Tax=Phycisphaera mikurensis (strain NBRC 102666 / KCTC 22515 / FYK2301M01) TaxID=1142394 RepID=I0IHF7_PHYMF|nr:sugar phosphate isomerase/epimerase [Phycisphaera mikurensis]MBB6440942.1 sugar phosphate isomerase/epimerase [Phycisphaera mikurensis]BAM04695.1 hypothetical protein PSMK_25360 [Phycisphaera mikurensis NBRC 102666]
MPDNTRLAVQLYTLRSFTQTPSDIAATFEKLAAQGWRAVQDSAMGEIETAELKKIADDNGIAVIASHVSLDQIEKDPQAMIDRHQALGCTNSAIGGFFPSKEDFTEDKWSAFIDRFNAAAAKLREGGIHYGYHNHSHEWIRFGNPLETRRPIDLLLERLAPEVPFELDTYWVAHAGGNPAAWIKKVHGRIPCVHLKDMLMGLDPREPVMAEIGVGNLDWPSILGACADAGVKHYIVEQDHCWRDPFDSLQTSLENLKTMGLS